VKKIVHAPAIIKCRNWTPTLSGGVYGSFFKAFVVGLSKNWRHHRAASPPRS